jgi:tetratricopeptide (TPR) repeat protein
VLRIEELQNLTRSQRNGWRIRRTSLRPSRICVGCLCALALGISSLTAQTDSVPSSSNGAKQLFDKGVALAQKGDSDGAIRTLEQALQVGRGSATILDAIGAAYSMKGDFKVAKTYFASSLQINPTFAPAMQNLGIACFTLGEFDEASAQFNVLRKLTGESRAVASLFLGMIAEKNADYAQAMALLDASGDLTHQYPDALLALANAALQLGNARRAEVALAGFDTLNNADALQRRKAADLYTRMGFANRARLELEETNGNATPEGESEYRMALALYEKHRLVESRRIVEPLAVSHPSADALLLLAHIAKEQDDFAVAMKSLQRAAKLDPTREESYLEYSSLCSEHGNDQLALDSANIGLENVPGSYRLLVQKGAVLDKLGQLVEAEEILREAGTLQQDNSIALLSLAVVLTHAGNVPEAEKTLASAITQFPQNHYMHYYRGKLLMQMAGGSADTEKLKAQAIKEFNQSVRYNPSHADSYYQLATLYSTALPNLEEDALLKCLKLDAHHPAAEYALARLYLRTGRKTKGEALLTQFKADQRSTEIQQEKQLRIDVAQK